VGGNVLDVVFLFACWLKARLGDSDSDSDSDGDGDGDSVLEVVWLKARLGMNGRMRVATHGNCLLEDSVCER
jgi:hypothetical protein